MLQCSMIFQIKLLNTHCHFISGELIMKVVCNDTILPFCPTSRCIKFSLQIRWLPQGDTKPSRESYLHTEGYVQSMYPTRGCYMTWMCDRVPVGLCLCPCTQNICLCSCVNVLVACVSVCLYMWPCAYLSDHVPASMWFVSDCVANHPPTQIW